MLKKEKRPAVSVLIPSYMGQSLLFKHLAKVLAIMRPGDQLLVVDDASPDQGLTKNYLIKKFKLKIENQNRWSATVYKGQWQGIEIVLAINQENLRFAETVNFAFKLAKHRLSFLINNDVAPNSDVLEYLIPHFEDKKIFAVTCLEKNGTDKKDWAGKNRLWFEQGMFKHSRANDFSSGPTAWASGGSSLIDRDKFLELGGFDKRFKPAYWEDIDLSFQARKRGWRVLFESQAIVEHHHESTNQGVFGQEKIDRMSWKNAKKFSKKNADFWQKIAYRLWRPYWLIQEMKLFGQWPTFKHYAALVTILLLASALRFYQLGRVPQGMALDEAAIGYNGFAIWQARRDEWLEFLPISFRSYGDYKAPLAIYINAFSTAVFGLNLWAVRLPFVIFSILAILGIYYLVKELLKQAKMNDNLALWVAFFLAVSPWHLHYSRLGFEAGIALSLLIWGVYFFYRYLRQQKLWQIILAAFLASLTLYTYHSAKVTTPLLFLIIWLSQRGKGKIKWGQLLITILVTNFLLSPLLYNAVFEEGFTRAGSSALFADIAWSEKLDILFNNTLSYFSWDFLARGQVLGQLRHGDGRFGVLSYPALASIVVYALSLFSKKVPFKKASNRILNLALIWIVIGYLPAIIGDQPFHSNRALLALPGWILLEVLAFQRISQFFKKQKWDLKAPVLIAYALFLIIYQRHYYQTFAKESASAFSDGYLATLEYLKKLDKTDVDKILFTNDYQHAYIYVLFANKVNPIAYHGGILASYEFSENIDFQDLNREKTIVVASLENEMMHYEADHIIYGSDGSERFRIYLPKE
jgi:GT2 family glycosyltransferase/4-amino-4-deoxy-L-arabinose transferase-like glycosyltransferase